MWQTIVTIIVLVGAAIFVARHFLKVYRTGSDPGCSGCSGSGCCGAKPDADGTCADHGPAAPRQGQ
ncbi:MAG: FeoB-associated Cys-rich membrane protein [Deltaproteobacteria bacterium]|jgi:hypothetical protein|nr:FeoB-associated Cys-rich membrane protein [Deltaproteobacteria bacterium]